MTIQALPPSTTARLGSTQIILDPYSVVKELLENALDARATSVSIEIASNGLDLIQVRDNGHGIAPGDRDLVCVRHCTSKIRDVEELKVLGGRSLGFRGEALSSLAEIAGALSVTTRVEGEKAAAKMEIGRDGRVSKYVSCRLMVHC